MYSFSYSAPTILVRELAKLGPIRTAAKLPLNQLPKLKELTLR